MREDPRLRMPVMLLAALLLQTTVLARMRLPYLRKAAPEVIATARAQRWDPAEVLRVLLIEEATGRKVDVVMTNMKWPSPQVLARYAQEHKEPLAPGNLSPHCELVGGELWTSDIARHDRLRLAYAVWSVLSERLLDD